MTTTTQPEITRIEFVNAPGATRPTSTLANFDRTARMTPEMLHYVLDRRSTIYSAMCAWVDPYLAYAGRDDLLDKDRSDGFARLVLRIDADKFFNGDKTVERILNILDDTLAHIPNLPDGKTAVRAMLEFFRLVHRLDNPRLEQTPEQQRAIDDGKRLAQAYERQQREKKRAKQKTKSHKK